MIIKKKSIEFRTQWPEGVDLSKISVNAVFTINLEDGSSVSINCDKIKRPEKLNACHQITVSRNVTLDPELLFDEEGCFTIEAELKVKFKVNPTMKRIPGSRIF